MLRIVLLLTGVVGAAYILVQHTVTQRRHERQARQWGCDPPWRERRTWFGLKIVREFIQAMQEERAPQYFIHWQERNAGTYVTKFVDTDIIQTTEPANIQALLATQFEDFSLGYRLQSWSPMFGKGIFTTDGAEW